MGKSTPAERELLLVRRALEREEISLGRAAEILGLSREDMREQAREWFGRGVK
ncbi:MAG: hypothetical protein M5T61_18185 [Acidimicrobiia bacterium]|nr:hypothetical protein [Acidimicrobiia bacterium]